MLQSGQSGGYECAQTSNKPSHNYITESWANKDIADAEFRLTGYVMFRRDRIGRRGGGVILYIKEYI